jgi:hypothetical protein
MISFTPRPLLAAEEGATGTYCTRDAVGSGTRLNIRPYQETNSDFQPVVSQFNEKRNMHRQSFYHFIVPR